jgi:hypothetical protein
MVRGFVVAGMWLVGADQFQAFDDFERLS